MSLLQPSAQKLLRAIKQCHLQIPPDAGRTTAAGSRRRCAAEPSTPGVPARRVREHPRPWLGAQPRRRRSRSLPPPACAPFICQASRRHAVSQRSGCGAGAEHEYRRQRALPTWNLTSAQGPGGLRCAASLQRRHFRLLARLVAARLAGGGRSLQALSAAVAEVLNLDFASLPGRAGGGLPGDQGPLPFLKYAQSFGRKAFSVILH